MKRNKNRLRSIFVIAIEHFTFVLEQKICFVTMSILEFVRSAEQRLNFKQKEHN